MKRLPKVRAYSVRADTIKGRGAEVLVFDESSAGAELQIDVPNSNKVSKYLGWSDVEVHARGDGFEVKPHGRMTEYVDDTHPSWSFISRRYKVILKHIDDTRYQGED